MDVDGAPYFSCEGCTQGDPLGPFLFAVGYHHDLLRTQAAHPDVTLLAYLDDTYYLGAVADAEAALATGDAVCRSQGGCGVASNTGKQPQG